MKRYLHLFFPFFLLTCTSTEDQLPTPEPEIEAAEPEEVVITSPTTTDNCEAGLLCLPPIGVDTSCVQMQMIRDGIFYKPFANYACVVPNPFLNITQIWVNGSIPIGQQVVTILFPEDIEVGTYPIFDNTAYDAFYVPTINADNFTAQAGTLIIVEHDLEERYIVGTFEFIAENQTSPVTPEQEFKEGCFAAHY